MGQYNKAIITAAGEGLIARAIVGEIQLSITKAKTSDHKYPDSTDFKALTDMQGIKQVVDSPETKVLENDLIQTRTLFSNEEIKATYYIHNIGLYAMDGTQEVLFCIVTATTPDEMPQYNGVAATSYIYNIQNVVQDAETINITVSTAGNATIQDVMERVDATGGDISETVIETLEPIDTKYPVPSAGESTKVFMGKVKKYIEDTKPLEEDMTVYVATTGSDTIGDGTSAKPYKTITYALSTIPKNLGDHTATINVADGTYAEDVKASGFYTGFLTICSSVENSFNANCVVQSLAVWTCFANVKLQGLTVAEETNKNAIHIVNSHTVDVSYIRSLKENPTTSCVVCVKSYVSIAYCELSNHLRAVYATEGSTVFLDNSTGIGDILNLAGSIVTSRNSSFIGSTVVNPGGILVSPYGAKIGTLSNDTILYVATTGSDTTGDGTATKPYKTIQRAINAFPNDLGGSVATVYIEDGTYNEDVTVKAFYNGSLGIYSKDHKEALNDACVVASFNIVNNAAVIYLSGIKLVELPILTEPIKVVRSTVRFDYLKIVENYKSNLTAIWIRDQSNASILNCQISNHMIGVHADNCRVYVASCSGSGNSTAFYARFGATVSVTSNNMTGNIITNTDLGGIFYGENGTQISSMITSGLSCAWGAISGGYIRHGNLNGTAMITIQMGIVTNTALSSSGNYSIKGFPLPATGNSVITFGPQNVVSNCYLSGDTILFNPSVNIGSGAGFLLNATYLTNS